MISERPCDTEDWGSDADISGINYVLKYKTIFYCIFDKINATLVSIRDFC